jgi:hypothetical protein
MQKVWNNQPIKDMDTDHIVNTINYMERTAKSKYAKEELEVSTTIDSHRAQAFEELSWYDLLPEEYYHLLAERDSRKPDTGLNF